MLVIFSNKNTSYKLLYICWFKRHIHLNFLLSHVCVFVCVWYMCHNTHGEVGTAGRSHFSLSIMWVLEIELTSSGLLSKCLPLGAELSLQACIYLYSCVFFLVRQKMQMKLWVNTCQKSWNWRTNGLESGRVTQSYSLRNMKRLPFLSWVY